MKEATEEKDLSTKIQAEEAELDLLLEALEAKEEKPSVPSGTSNQSYERSLKIMELNDALKSVRKFGPGVPAEDFIETLDQKYKIFVQPHLKEYSFLESEYVKRSLDAMHPTYVNQALNSGEEIKSFEDFKRYVNKVHGTKQSNFQILNKSFSLQPNEGESYNDFAARLDISFRQAATRIIGRHKAQKKTSTNPDPVVSPEVVFQLASALVMAQMVRKTNKPIYDQMCRKMDEYDDALRVGAEAQKLHDRGVRPDDNVEVIHYGGHGGSGGSGGHGGHGGHGGPGGSSKNGTFNGQTNGNNTSASNKGKGNNGNRPGKPGRGKPPKKNPTNADGTCKWGTKCFKLAKGTCPHPHKDVAAHAADTNDGGNGGYTYNGYTYEDFRQIQA